MHACCPALGTTGDDQVARPFNETGTILSAHGIPATQYPMRFSLNRREKGKTITGFSSPLRVMSQKFVETHLINPCFQVHPLRLYDQLQLVLPGEGAQGLDRT